jgi:hypothetical protein
VARLTSAQVATMHPAAAAAGIRATAEPLGPHPAGERLKAVPTLSRPVSQPVP